MTIKAGCESAYHAGRASRDAEVEALKADAIVDAQLLEKLDSRVVELNEQLEAARIYQETVLALQEK